MSAPAATLAPRVAWTSPVVPWSGCDRERKRLLQAAWEIGELSYHLTPSQERAYQKIRKWENSKTRKGRVFALDSSRRWGKSVLQACLAIENCIRNNSWRIVYCAPEYKMVKKIIIPLISMLTVDCPPQLMPEWVKSEETYYFKNGSRLELVGLDVNPDGARGTGIDYGFFDEAAFFQNLEYLLQSVVRPQMLGRPHARLVCASTPPISPSHYWSSELVPTCIAEDAHDIRTLEEAEQYSPEEIEEFIKDAGGRKSVTCRREYFCEHVTDETMAIIPEFRDVQDEIVKAVEPPRWRDCYVSMDPGWKDFTAVLFGYSLFEEKKLVIEDEIVGPRLNSADIAAAIKLKEDNLWAKIQRRAGNGQMKSQPYLRVSDLDQRLLIDLSRDHQLPFAPTQKDNLDQQINSLRVAMGQKRILIHPRCKTLILHLKNGVWRNETRKQFAWEGGQMGHFDCIAALVYMWRNVHWHRNPAPRIEQYVGENKHHHRQHAEAKPASKWSRHRGALRLR